MARRWNLIAGVAAAACAACSSSGDTGGGGGPKDSGGPETSTTVPPVTDGSTTLPDDANGSVGTDDADPRATACTAPPFVTFNASLTTLDVGGTTAPAAGATIEFSTCTGYKITTGSNGSASTQITQSIPLSPIYSDGPGVISAIGAEIPATGDVSPAVALLDVDVTASIPGFAQDGGNAATIAVVLQTDPLAGAACDSVAGATLSVTGHPEAVVSYMGTAWPGDATVATSALGPYVFINGVQGADKVAITGAKAGCSVLIASGSQTGNFLLVPGSVTIGVATVTN